MDFVAQFRPTQTISVNPPGGTGHHGHHGHHGFPAPTVPSVPDIEYTFIGAGKSGMSALWVVFALFTIGLVGMFLVSFRVEKRARLFHLLSGTVLGIAMVSYFAMATGKGVTWVPTHYDGKAPQLHKVLREVYYARYIDWLFTTPLLLVSLAFLGGLSPFDGLIVILFDIGMIVTGLLGGVTPARWHDGEKARWAFFAVSCLFFLGIWYILLVNGAQAAAQRPRRTRGLYWLLTLMTIALWTAYPIVFGLTEGANKISVDAEIIAYGVLDVAAKLGFGYLLIFLHSHGDGDGYVLPDWMVNNKAGQEGGADGRGRYGALGQRDE